MIEHFIISEGVHWCSHKYQIKEQNIYLNEPRLIQNVNFFIFNFQGGIFWSLHHTMYLYSPADG